MALVGTISGSNSTSNTAVTGTLVIANTITSFPTISSDAVFFVSGNIGGTSKSVIGGDLVTSGTTKLFSDLTLSGSNVFIGGNVSFQNDILFLDKTNARVGIGTSNPDGDLTVRTTGTTNIRGITGLHYDNTTAFSQFKFIGGRARGSTGSPTAVQANDSLASFNGRGYKTTGWSNTVGGLYVYAKETWTDSNTPTYITLRGVAAGAGTTVSEWAKIESTGITATSFTGSNLLLNGEFIMTGSGIIEANSATPALRVTQQGSGNAITVEDSANPDLTPFVVKSDGKVGIGNTSPTANLFVSGNDPLATTFVAKGPDVTVNTLTVTGSAGASTAIGFVNIDQGNYANKYGLMISNIGTGQSGLKLSANTTGGSFAIDNMNTTPQITMTHKNLWFNSVSTAFDTSQVTYKFIENNKAATYPNQKTFLISGNTNGPKTGSYFEVEKSGSLAPVKLLELQGDTQGNTLFVSGNIVSSGTLSSLNSIGSEGGELFLSKAATGTVLNTGVTIDVYNDKLRIFETGGTNRGAYIDVSALGSGVSTDLLFSGSFYSYTSTSGSPFTLTIPTAANTIEIEAVGGGGGGGSGRRGALGNNIYGGGGGSGGGRVLYRMSADSIRALSSTLTITIGSGGSGGAARTADNTDGAAGSPGNNTTVSAGATTLVTAVGGSNGQGGTGAAGGAGIAPFSQTTGGNGASGQIPPTAAPGGTNSVYTGGGGAGGGRDATNPAAVVQPGGGGGSGGDLFIDNVKRAGTSGTSAGGNGGNATVAANPSPVGGGGGGGGGSANGVDGGAGGNGIQGGGGGGGGAATNGFNSGKGGDGGTGWCIVRFE